MRSIIKFIFFLVAITLGVLGSSCKKMPGPGGRATVNGKIFAYDYDNTMRYLISKGYAPGEKVYISYGSHESADNKVETGADGTFTFRYLTKGHYKVFANSLDTAYKIKGNKTENAVIREFDITSTSQIITLEDIVINK